MEEMPAPNAQTLGQAEAACMPKATACQMPAVRKAQFPMHVRPQSWHDGTTVRPRLVHVVAPLVPFLSCFLLPCRLRLVGGVVRARAVLV